MFALDACGCQQVLVLYNFCLWISLYIALEQSSFMLPSVCQPLWLLAVVYGEVKINSLTSFIRNASFFKHSSASELKGSGRIRMIYWYCVIQLHLTNCVNNEYCLIPVADGHV